MAAFTYEGVMEGVADRLRTIDGLRVSFYSPDQVNPPHAVVGMPEVVNYHSAMGRGLCELSLAVALFVPGVDDRSGQLTLGDYANPASSRSVLNAIEEDRRLGGAVSSCVVTAFRPFGRQDVNGAQLYVGEFSLLIHAPGK